jgi:hypothetical protein
VYNADAISGRTGAVDIRANGPASLSSSVMGTSFMSLNQSTAANSLIGESVMGASHSSSLQFGSSLLSDHGRTFQRPPHYQLPPDVDEGTDEEAF